MADSITMDRDSTLNRTPDDLSRSLSDLSSITLLLQRYGFIALVFTVFNLALLILTSSLRLLPIVGALASVVITFYLPLIATLIAVVAIVRYETLRKRGDALFEEISDELQWNLRQNVTETIARERPELNARVALRSFARATDLPLIPGRYGPVIYVAINLVILFVGYYLLSLSRF
ncbi:MAG TPA: hypothetical protein VN844_16965 [Pyrinomonadaceae bacterium]|nr:hypothetical protein [Pyrinomonadaceae bacterium]